MRLRVNPLVFLLRLVAFLLLTYWLWGHVAPHYTQLLLRAARAGMWLSELSADPVHRAGTSIVPRPGRCTDTAQPCMDSTDCRGAACFLPPGGCARPSESVCDPRGDGKACGAGSFCAPVGNGQGRCFAREGACSGDGDCRGGARCVPTNIFYRHRLFASRQPPLPPQGIPAEWILANFVLLTSLMLATPAATWRLRLARLALAFVLILAAQVLDIVVTIKAFYASAFPEHWSWRSRKVFGLLNSFFQGFDTQLFPFAIWAGIHFRDLLAPRPARAGKTAGKPAR